MLNSNGVFLCQQSLRIVQFLVRSFSFLQVLLHCGDGKCLELSFVFLCMDSKWAWFEHHRDDCTYTVLFFSFRFRKQCSCSDKVLLETPCIVVTALRTPHDNVELIFQTGNHFALLTEDIFSQRVEHFWHILAWHVELSHIFRRNMRCSMHLSLPAEDFLPKLKTADFFLLWPQTLMQHLTRKSLHTRSL